jgi:hypothetical protein
VNSSVAVWKNEVLNRKRCKRLLRRQFLLPGLERNSDDAPLLVHASFEPE